MITPNSGMASFLAPNLNKLTVPFGGFGQLVHCPQADVFL